jgi:lipoprotein-releasing system permease protein
MRRLPFEFFLGLRYLKPKRTYVSVITLISLAGVIIGVWVLIVVIAVMTGFDREFRDKLIGMHAHVTVSGGLIEDSEELMARIRELPRVRAASPFVLGPVLIEQGARVATPLMKGVDLQREVRVSRFAEYVRQGRLDLDGEKVIVGQDLAALLDAHLGDRLTVYSPRNLQRDQQEVFLPVDLEVTGLFASGRFDVDSGFIFTSLETAQDLYGLGTAVHGIEVATDDPMAGAQEVARALNRVLPPPLMAQTWMDMNQDHLEAIALEKTMMFIILSFIVLVAAFSIMNTLITVTVQKTREIGVLKALGATPGTVLRVFVLQGFVVGIIGVACGVALGLATVENINTILAGLRQVGIDPFRRTVYGFATIPTHLSLRDLVTITLSAVGICTLAGLLPAWRAARLEPVEALRHE